MEEKAFKLQEEFNSVKQVMEEHTEVLNQAKEEYEKILKEQLMRCGHRGWMVISNYKISRNHIKSWELRGKGYKKKLEDLQVALTKHMEQTRKAEVEHEKLQSTLTEKALSDDCDLKKALEMVPEKSGIVR